jgi:predicted enzyme related to lactoylglutathione lyase
MDKDTSRLQQPQRTGDGAGATTRRTFVPAFALAVASSAVTAPTLGHAEQPTPAELGTVSWNELRTRKPAQARAFYAGVIGWTPKVVAQDDPSRTPGPGEKDYTIFATGDNEVAGAETIEQGAAADVRPGWLLYVQVSNVDEAAQRAVQLGGKIVRPPFDTPGNERMVEIEDTEGNRFGLVCPRK